MLLLDEEPTKQYIDFKLIEKLESLQEFIGLGGLKPTNIYIMNEDENNIKNSTDLKSIYDGCTISCQLETDEIWVDVKSKIVYNNLKFDLNLQIKVSVDMLFSTLKSLLIKKILHIWKHNTSSDEDENENTLNLNKKYFFIKSSSLKILNENMYFYQSISGFKTGKITEKYIDKLQLKDILGFTSKLEINIILTSVEEVVFDFFQSKIKEIYSDIGDAATIKTIKSSNKKSDKKLPKHDLIENDAILNNPIIIDNNLSNLPIGSKSINDNIIDEIFVERKNDMSKSHIPEVNNRITKMEINEQKTKTDLIIHEDTKNVKFNNLSPNNNIRNSGKKFKNKLFDMDKSGIDQDNDANITSYNMVNETFTLYQRKADKIFEDKKLKNEYKININNKLIDLIKSIQFSLKFKELLVYTYKEFENSEDFKRENSYFEKLIKQIMCDILLVNSIVDSQKNINKNDYFLSSSEIETDKENEDIENFFIRKTSDNRYSENIRRRERNNTLIGTNHVFDGNIDSYLDKIYATDRKNESVETKNKRLFSGYKSQKEDKVKKLQNPFPKAYSSKYENLNSKNCLSNSLLIHSTNLNLYNTKVKFFIYPSNLVSKISALNISINNEDQYTSEIKNKQNNIEEEYDQIGSLNNEKNIRRNSLYKSIINNNNKKENITKKILLIFPSDKQSLNWIENYVQDKVNVKNSEIFNFNKMNDNEYSNLNNNYKYEDKNNNYVNEQDSISSYSRKSSNSIKISNEANNNYNCKQNYNSNTSNIPVVSNTISNSFSKVNLIFDTLFESTDIGQVIRKENPYRVNEKFSYPTRHKIIETRNLNFELENAEEHNINYFIPKKEGLYSNNKKILIHLSLIILAFFAATIAVIFVDV